MSDSGSLPSWVNPACSRLGEQEKVWAHFQPLLEARGYMLRPRYRLGWFLPPATSPQVSETAIPARGTCEVLNATRVSHGAPVVLKIVQTVSSDTEISGFLTNEPGAEAHTLPTLDLVPMDDEWSFMVMPRIRGCAHPPFETVREVTEFVEQVLEGLVYLHNKNIAHRQVSLEIGFIGSSMSTIC
ncbi:hypothetical protein B0H19DRAFT_1256845 [Mycena capillaripes]|nr:hypothetical protein B0H19DRAFT_1256845 [Mycena capillaripes]